MDPAMRTLCLVSCCLITGQLVCGQTDLGWQQRALPQWLTATLAVAVFLFLVLVGFLVNKAWCQRPKLVPTEPVRVTEHNSNGVHDDTCTDTVRSIDHENADENMALEDAAGFTAM